MILWLCFLKKRENPYLLEMHTKMYMDGMTYCLEFGPNNTVWGREVCRYQ